ncbi:TPA: D-tyrosyl-tRNA(Tyr) deacylase [Candidatus Poribacteria bacterium]|nr:D-tyrosyl-tRNA(Tyr) deacylase [Candidatus Poribacteria bacterium]
MRAVLQRVKQASVTVDDKVVAEISQGLLILLGVAKEDTSKDIDYLANKVANLRIFQDDLGKMNLSLLEIGGEALVVSQFTLYGDCRKGRRPSFTAAAQPEKADEMYQEFIAALGRMGIKVKGGIFRAYMDVELVNDGPVTILLDSRKLF